MTHLTNLYSWSTPPTLLQSDSFGIWAPPHRSAHGDCTPKLLVWVVNQGDRVLELNGHFSFIDLERDKTDQKLRPPDLLIRLQLGFWNGHA